MASDYSEINSNVEHWVQHALAEGWIEKETAQDLLDQEKNSANDLFSSDSSRPLVVAFMGGTGVGKSSLLNKLAGQAIAKAGVERPTSREVTLFYHHSVSLHLLQEVFPIQQIKMAQHTEDANQQIIWIDMPDFDSTEQKNKDIVLQWLPFVDVLIYVVSPERYRDNKAWQLLLAEGASHAWVFAFNQWDRGEDAQYDDFKQQLAKAGFHNPLIFKTICTDQAEDEFLQLRNAIESIATEKTIKHLETRELQQRTDSIKYKLEDCLDTLGNADDFSIISKYQTANWAQTQDILIQGFQWPIQQESKRYAKIKIGSKQDSISLWDGWAQSRFNDYLDALIVTIDQQGLPALPIREKLTECRNNAKQIVHTQTELACRKALINPGNLLHRILLKTASICEFILPLLAMGAVGFEVFQGYYDSAISNESFLGVNFAVHSGLLILISWLFPFFIRKKMQPSLEKAALKGLYNGLEEAVVILDMDIKQAITVFKELHAEKTGELNQLIIACNNETEKVKVNETNSQLNRMLVN